MRKTLFGLTSTVTFVLVFSMMAHAQAPASVAGKWIMMSNGSDGTAVSTMRLTQDGATIKGTMKPENGDELTIESGTVKGQDVTFSVTRKGKNGDSKVEYKGTVSGDSMKGTFQQGQESVKWTAKRSIYEGKFPSGSGFGEMEKTRWS